MRVWSAVHDLQHKTQDHSSGAVNCLLHDQAHALPGLLYDTLTWTAMTAYWLHTVFWLQSLVVVGLKKVEGEEVLIQGDNM